MSGTERAYHFLQQGELCGTFPPPQRNQVYLLIDRIDGLAPATHIPPEVVGFACGFSLITSQPIALIEHGPNYSVGEKSAILAEYQEDIEKQLGVKGVSVLPLKTITLCFKHEGVPNYVLFTRVGDLPLDGTAKRDLAPVLKRLLQTEHKPLRDLVINPLEFDPKLMLGIEPGLVSPFVRAGLTGTLKGLLYYGDNSFDGFVAVAVSPNDTLIVHKTVFHNTLLWWQGDFLGVPYRTVQNTRPKRCESVESSI